MNDPIVFSPRPDAGSRRWAFWVSISLWLFAAWQVRLLTPLLTAFKTFSIPAPGWSDFMNRVSPWLLFAVGLFLTLATLALRSRTFRSGVLALALLAALSAHWANAALDIKLVQASRVPPVAAR